MSQLSSFNFTDCVGSVYIEDVLMCFISKKQIN